MKIVILLFALLTSATASAKSESQLRKLFACAPEAASAAVEKSGLKDPASVNLNIESDDFETKVIGRRILQYEAHVVDSLTGNAEIVVLRLNASNCALLP